MTYKARLPIVSQEDSCWSVLCWHTSTPQWRHVGAKALNLQL